MAGERSEILNTIEAEGLVAVIRVPGSGDDGVDDLVKICAALADGGVSVAEITMTSPGALDAIKRVSEELADTCLVGVGSVLDGDTARAAILAGAKFVVSPVMRPDVIDTTHRYGLPVVCGALTPTEVLDATEAGADLVKVFPANHFGPKYFKDLLGPMPHLRLTPTGGVNLETAASWLEAGAVCLGVGSALVQKDVVAAGDFDRLTERARQFADVVAAARET